MSVAVTVVLKDTATPELKRKLSACDPQRVATRVAPILARHWRDHLKGLPRNKGGYPSTGFWEDAARRCIGIAENGNVRLSNDKLGLRKRLYGGPVRAVNHNNVTIPICAEAYGTTVSDWGFDNLVLVILGDGRKFYALWLGNEESQRKFHDIFKGNIHRSEVTTRRAMKVKTALSGQEKPKVIVFRGKGGSASSSRAEKHLNLKFLFRLMQETGDQAANPNVIPPDLQQKAVALITEAVE